MNLLIGALLALQDQSGTITLEHARAVSYTRTSFEAGCRGHVIRVVYRDDSNAVRGRVERFEIDGRTVEGAAKGLQQRAAGRVIEKIGIMHCGMDEERPVVRGVMNHSPIESKSHGLAPNVYFDLRRDKRRWTIVWGR